MPYHWRGEWRGAIPLFDKGMSGSKAKKIRRQIYGDMSYGIPRDYVVDLRGTISNHPNSLRAKYQRAKKEINGNPRNPNRSQHKSKRYPD